MRGVRERHWALEGLDGAFAHTNVLRIRTLMPWSASEQESGVDSGEMGITMIFPGRAAMVDAPPSIPGIFSRCKHRTGRRK